MSSNTTGERMCAPELSATTRASPRSAAPSARARRRPVVSAKCPRWLVANCSSHPSAVRSRSLRTTPALSTSRCSGPCHSSASRAGLDRSARSSSTTVGVRTPGIRPISSAASRPFNRLRTASVTTAPATASARAVSTPRPDDAPVTRARTPSSETPSTTSSAVLCAVNLVVINARDRMPSFCSQTHGQRRRQPTTIDQPSPQPEPAAGRAPHPVAGLLPHHPTAPRGCHLRAELLRAHREPGQPARQPEGSPPDR